jgi:hypothetical protein
MTNIPSKYSGFAGEYLVCAEICLRNAVAVLAPKGQNNIDILASSNNGLKTCSIQVKVHQKTPDFVLSDKSECLVSDDLFYVFVCIVDLKLRPDYYIVPSGIVSAYCRDYHDKYLERNGHTRETNTITMRKFHDHGKAYLEQWENLPIFTKIL